MARRHKTTPDSQMIVKNGVVVPRGKVGRWNPFLSIYSGPWGYFLTKAQTPEQRHRNEANVFRRYGYKPLYRVNLKDKGTTNT